MSRRGPKAPKMEADLEPADKQLCFKSQLALFDQMYPTQDCIVKKEEIRHSPTMALQPDSQILEFSLQPIQNVCYDLSSITLRLSVKIMDGPNDIRHALKHSEDDLESDYDPVTLACSPLQTLFRQCEVYINDQPTTNSSLYHHYRFVVYYLFD